MPCQISIERLRAAHVIVAGLSVKDPTYLPIFERLERELVNAEDREDALFRARAVAQTYRAKGASRLR